MTVTKSVETPAAPGGYEQTRMEFVLNPNVLQRFPDTPSIHPRAAAMGLVEMGVETIGKSPDSSP